MFGAWWLFWLIFLLFLIAPTGYGWGYRKWGPPYPRYIQRRRAAAIGGSPTFNHQAWGFTGDFVWMVMIIGVFWACAALWWR